MQTCGGHEAPRLPKHRAVETVPRVGSLPRAARTPVRAQVVKRKGGDEKRIRRKQKSSRSADTKLRNRRERRSRQQARRVCNTSADGWSRHRAHRERRDRPWRRRRRRRHAGACSGTPGSDGQPGQHAARRRGRHGPSWPEPEPRKQRGGGSQSARQAASEGRHHHAVDGGARGCAERDGSPARVHDDALAAAPRESPRHAAIVRLSRPPPPPPPVSRRHAAGAHRLGGRYAGIVTWISKQRCRPTCRKGRVRITLRSLIQ
mmetsp:Transcript_12747/g.28970  ORF Transcript_12747/g.28970 Transcript_12747/m.28970 type:complete len:261 (-) Transcript_12747:22-804(-)